MNSEISHLIATGQIEIALQKMLPDYPAAFMLSANYHSAKNEKIAGVLSYDEWSRAQAKITNSMLEVLRMAPIERPLVANLDTFSQNNVVPPPPKPGEKKKALKVFLSYAHKDEELKSELDMHLAGLRRMGKIDVWQDRKLDLGTEWDDEIKEQLASADVILLLVSAAFLASDYIWKVEIEGAMARHARKEAVVVPIILKPCEWKDMPFARLQALPRDAKPVTSYGDKDQALAEIAGAIRRLVDSRTTA